jgi:dihydroxy-acid dehydratase
MDGSEPASQTNGGSPQRSRRLRSGRWLRADGVAGLLHRATLRSQGFSGAAIEGRPVVGICNSWSEFTHCNMRLRALADAVRRGVALAGGLAIEFPTISLGENLMKPTTMLYRNLMAMDVEESIRAHPMDAVVLLAGCDKTIPAQLLGAASAGVPAIMLTSGPGEPGRFQGRDLATGTDLWRATDDLRAGRLSRAEFDALEDAIFPGAGHCSEMGTASTMAILTEALGMSLPGSALVSAVGARRAALAEQTGARAVELALEGPTPADVLTDVAFDNAITTLMAIGGSTNAVVHLIALARRLGIGLTLDRFDEIARTTPMLVAVRPAGDHLVKDVEEAGGAPALLAELMPLLHGEAMTVTGQTLAANVAAARVSDRSVIATLDEPVQRDGGLAVLRGSLAPEGALIKTAAASSHLLRHRGPALVFDDINVAAQRLEDPDLDVTPDTVLVLRNAGPKGGPGFPEWGMLPIPTKLLRQGVTDVVRVSDARMSGTGFGTIVVHAAPEAAVGGPLAVVRDGDPIVLDVKARRLDVELPRDELERRLGKWARPAPVFARGYGAVFLDHVLQAPDGCDFDFLQRPDGSREDREPAHVHEWVGGW